MDKNEKGSYSPPSEQRGMRKSDESARRVEKGEEVCHHYGHYPNYDHHYPHNKPKAHPSRPCHRLHSSPGTP